MGGIYCTNEVCDLYREDQNHFGMPGLSVTTLYSDGSTRLRTWGKPSQGEANVPRVCRTFLEVLRRERRLEFGDLEDVSASKEDLGVDARVPWPNGSFLRMQVTRALPQDVYEEQGRIESVTRKYAPLEPATMLRAAIESKSGRARPDVTLLIDGTSAAVLALPAPTHFVTLHGEWAMREGWESIWVVGSSFAKRLDLVHGPEIVPDSWRRG